jgi:hypothetical protein
VGILLESRDAAFHFDAQHSFPQAAARALVDAASCRIGPLAKTPPIALLVID